MTCANLCAHYRLRWVSRVTGQEVDLGRLGASMRFRRVLSETSEMEITMPLRPECLGQIPEPWADEVVAERMPVNGNPEGVAWRGTVTNTEVDFEAGQIIITAHDNSVWWTRTQWVGETIQGTFDQSTLWATLVRDTERHHASGLALQPAVPAGLDRTVDLAVGDRNQFLIFEGLTDVQWTVEDRQVYGPGPAPTEQSSAVAHLVLDQHWATQPVITGDGEGRASQVMVEAVDLDGTITRGFYPPSPVFEERYGYHGIRVDLEASMTEAQAVAYARRVFDADKDGHEFVVTSGSTLTESAPVNIWGLRCGQLYSVSGGEVAPLNGLFRLYNVVVEGIPDGGLLRETRVAVDLQPFGTELRAESRLSL